MTESERSYLPAAGKHLFLPFYDPLTKLIGADKSRRTLLDQAELARGQRVLDVGCGTGTLAVEIKRREPRADVAGLDPDPKALARARRKAERAGVTIRLDRGFADSMPYSDASFDRVLSSFMFHHLGKDEKLGMLREILRVLEPGGRLELVDFAGHDHGGHGRIRNWLHSQELLEDNAEDHVIALLREVGFVEPRIVRRGSILVGSVVYYQARRA